jgi:hypothetical protein
MGANSPVSGRKVREAAGKALASTNLQAEMLKGLIDKHNSFVSATHTACDHLAGTLDTQRALFTGRGFFGRLKFLVLGK